MSEDSASNRKSGFPVAGDTDLHHVGERFTALCEVMKFLRSPEGCDWDRAQSLSTLRPYLLEETHEVLAALDALEENGGRPQIDEHRDELGDLLLQVVFQSEIQREQGHFDAGDVCEAIRQKLIRRHPHLFAGAAPIGDPAKKDGWEALKRAEREAKGVAKKSALDGVPKELPALLRAYRTGEKARGAGFDWPTHDGVVAKVEEELAEVKEAIAGGDKKKVASEIGDILYALVNLARHFEIDPEAALRGTIQRFETRFRIVEAGLAREGRGPEQASLDELEERWQAAKKQLAAAKESA